MKFYPWVEERLKLKPLVESISGKKVPQHRFSFWYVFGGLSLFFFLIQLLTGVLLLVYYSSTPNTANESVHFIVDKVSFGWLIRSIHSWSANLMIITVFLHFFSTYFMKAYRRPREILWLSGVILLFLSLGFGFTGYLLPWDTTAYFATQIGTEIPRSIPFIGNLVVEILRGGEFIAEECLKRLFALHAVVFPLIANVVIFFHLVLSQVHGSSTPLGLVVQKPSISFFPNFLYRDALAWLIALTLLLALCLLFPINVGAKADTLASAPAGIKPEWYFLPLFQTLRMLPATFWGMNCEMLINIGVMLFGLFLFLIPFIDRKASQEQNSHFFSWIGVVIVTYMVLSIGLAYLT